MGYHIGVGEIAIGSERAAHILEKGQVDVDRLIGRTIERAYRSIGIAAAARCRTGVKHEPRRLILTTHTAENFGPHILGARKYLLGEVGKRLLFGRGLILLAGIRHHLLRSSRELRKNSAYVTAEKSNDESHEDSYYAASGQNTSGSASAPIVDVRTFASSVKSHLIMSYNL